MSFNSVEEFENKIAEFYGAPYAVAVDCCTHGVELCLRLQGFYSLIVPCRTYLSIPMLAKKLDIGLTFIEEEWKDYYEVRGWRTEEDRGDILDAAVFWKRDGYIPGKFMCLSFQFQKHLSLGRGGMIVTGKQSGRELNKTKAHCTLYDKYAGSLGNSSSLGSQPICSHICRYWSISIPPAKSTLRRYSISFFRLPQLFSLKTVQNHSYNLL